MSGVNEAQCRAAPAKVAPAVSLAAGGDAVFSAAYASNEAAVAAAVSAAAVGPPAGSVCLAAAAFLPRVDPLVMVAPPAVMAAPCALKNA